jgi:hypothetical protein
MNEGFSKYKIQYSLTNARFSELYLTAEVQSEARFAARRKKERKVR